MNEPKPPPQITYTDPVAFAADVDRYGSDWFGAWGLELQPGKPAVIIAGADGPADWPSWNLPVRLAATATKCCGTHTGFSATNPAVPPYVRGLACDIGALFPEHERHAENHGAAEALYLCGKALGVDHYRSPLYGYIGLYLPALGDADHALKFDPELACDIATEVNALISADDTERNDQ